ncbi:hypothetical protein [Pseudomonas sp. GWSMS-1]|uniref:hypothetical protein n=1 Tax=Pseudomonas sp. GWSMS-1 TaxID=3308997 RepID=UPI003CF23DEB
MKKFVLAATIAIFVLAQAFFIYALLQPETDNYFASLWSSFGVQQTSYSKFVFKTIQWWAVLPVICLALGILAIKRSSKSISLFAISASALGTIALYWSAYAPTLFISI